MINMINLFQTIDEMSLDELKQLIRYAKQREENVAKMPKFVSEATNLSERIPGLFVGGWMSDDFDDELPDSFWLGEDEE